MYFTFLGERGKLTWHIRYNIALGAAAGLAYLHEGCQRRIIHRDIKAANVLLTEDFEAQVCLCTSHHAMKICGVLQWLY